MNRRHFLGGAAAAAAIAAWPSFLRRAFGDSSVARSGQPAPETGHVVEGAWRRALAAGRPMLVFVVPKNDQDKYERGHAFGEYLNNSTDAALAPLARAEVVCATMDELRGTIQNAGDGEPLLVLVDKDRPIARFEAALPKMNRMERGRWEESDREAEVVIDKRMKLLADWIAARLPVDNAQAAALAADAKQKLRAAPPPGAHWARSSGCGTDIEGVRESMVDCGMGHVPRKSQRFLYLFSVTPNDKDG